MMAGGLIIGVGHHATDFKKAFLVNAIDVRLSAIVGFACVWAGRVTTLGKDKDLDVALLLGVILGALAIQHTACCVVSS